MKKLLSVLFGIVVFSAITTTAAQAEEIYGLIYKNTVEPGGGSGSVTTGKVGTAVCKSYFGIAATGDCSIKTAMTNGKINNLSHYDKQIKNILGFKTVTVKAYGQ